MTPEPSDWANEILLAASRARFIRPPGRVVLGTPTVGWDDCCAGLLGVELVGFAFSGQSWPSPGQESFTPFGVDCSNDIWRAEYRVTVLRCVPVFAGGMDGEQGAPPEVKVVNKAAMDLYADGFAVWKALRCAAASGGRLAEMGRSVVGALQPVAASGGCGGYTMSVVCKVKDCVADCP